MNINLTLIGQAIAFAVFVAICMKYIWPPLIGALRERQQRIAEGLAAAERGRHQQALAEQEAQALLKKAKQEAAAILDQAQRQGAELVEAARAEAEAERRRIVEAGNAEIEQAVGRAREDLRREVAALALAAAERILEREIDAAAHQRLIDELLAEARA